jgi:integrase
MPRNHKNRRRAPGEGLVRQRADGRWEARIDLGWMNGKRVRRPYYARTQAEVLDKLAKARVSLKLGMPVAVNRQTVAEYLDRWLNDSAKLRIKPRTYDRFAELIRIHINPAIGRVRLEKLSSAHIQQLITEKYQTLSAQTVVHLRNLLRNALNQAVKWGLVGRNVATLVDVPRIERPAVRVLSAEESNRLLDAAKGDRFEAVYSVGLALGLRRGELLGLGWESVDLDRAEVRVIRSLQRVGGKLELCDTKTPKGRRTIPLPAYAVRALRVHRARQIEERLANGPAWQDNGLVFTGRHGTPLEPITLHRDFKSVLKKAGLPSIRFHNLRHSAASLMLAQGVPLKTIQEILGHSSIAVTSGFYAHLGEQLKRDAADAMDRVLGS